jgi:transglutaminase-like putative cysteine protease
VSTSHWAYAQISSAAAYGWIKGYTDGTFQPSGTITRSEAVAIINRCLGRSADSETTQSMVKDGGLRRFCDISATSWYYNEVIEASTPHNYHLEGTQEVWDSYTALSCGLDAGMVTIGNYFYHVNENGQFDSYSPGRQAIDGKTYYVNDSGLIPRLSAGVQELGDALVCVQSDGSLLTSSTYGYLTFGADGAYTSGDATLDALVDKALATATTAGASAETRLRQAYVYIRDNYSYLSRSHHSRGSTDWTIESATFFLQNGKGNCYCFAASFLYMARRLGFQAYPISGGVGSNNADHAWVMINWSDGKTYLFDVELEYAYHHRYTGSRHNPSLDIYKKLRSQYPFAYHFPS